MIKLLFVLLASKIAFAQTLPVDDDKFGCTDSAKAQQYVHDFNIDIASFGGIELCNTKIDSKKLFNDLQLIEKGQFNTSGQNLFIHGFIKDTSYYPWFKSQTRGMDRGNDVPYATAYNSGGYFTMQNGWTLLSTLGRVGTVIHEARHTQGYFHIACTFGPYAGSGLAGCDRDYNYGGSHAVEMEYYARVTIQGENFHPVYKTMARLMAIARANFVFNANPIKSRQALLAIDEKNETHLLVDNQTVSRQTPNLANSVLKRTSFGAVLFDGVQALAIELYQNIGAVSNKIVDDYSYFKLLKDDRGQGSDPLADVEEYDSGTRRYFVYLSNTGKMGSFNFPNGAFGSPVNGPNGASHFVTVNPETGADGLGIVTRSGDIYMVQPESMQFSQPLKTKWAQDVSQMTRFNNDMIILKSNGQVASSSKAFEPFKGLNIQQIVTVPAYDAFEVSP